MVVMDGMGGKFARVESHVDRKHDDDDSGK
jgi:hypothetical protein